MEYQHGLYQDHAHTQVGVGIIGTLPSKIEISKSLKGRFKMAFNHGRNIHVGLEGIHKCNVCSGIFLQIEGEEMQAIIAWDEDKLFATIKPGFINMIEEGTKVIVTIPSRLCTSLFRSPNYDQEKKEVARKLIQEMTSNEEKIRLEAQIRSFSSENDASTASLRDLKATWIKHADVNQCLTMNNYKEPKHAAQFMFVLH